MRPALRLPGSKIRRLPAMSFRAARPLPVVDVPGFGEPFVGLVDRGRRGTGGEPLPRGAVAAFDPALRPGAAGPSVALAHAHRRGRASGTPRGGADRSGGVHGAVVDGRPGGDACVLSSSRQQNRHVVFRGMCGGFPAGWASLRFARCLCFVLVGLFGHEGVSAAVAFALEADDPSVADGAVDDRGGHVGVAEHASPSAGLDVGGVDDAPCLVGIGYDLEQEPAAFLVDG